MLCFVILAVIFSSLSHFNLTESFRIAVTKVAQAECLPCSQIKFWWTVFAWWNTHLDCHNSCNYIIICSNLHSILQQIISHWPRTKHSINERYFSTVLFTHPKDPNFIDWFVSVCSLFWLKADSFPLNFPNNYITEPFLWLMSLTVNIHRREFVDRTYLWFPFKFLVLRDIAGTMRHSNPLTIRTKK